MNPVPFTTLAAAMDFVVGDRNYPLSELFMKGGFIMWPLLLLSIAGVVVLVMCCFSTRASAVLPTKLVEQAESFIRKRDYTGLSILQEWRFLLRSRDVDCSQLHVAQSLRPV